MTLRSHSKVLQHKLSSLWLQDYSWRFRSSTVIDLVAATLDLPDLMIWERFLVVTFIEEGTIPFRSHKSTSKVSIKRGLGFSLYTMWNRSKILITYWANGLLGLIKILQNLIFCNFWLVGSNFRLVGFHRIWILLSVGYMFLCSDL